MAQPSWHADVLEPAAGVVEQRQGAVGVAGRSAPLAHNRFVEVGDGAERPRPLLLEYVAGAGEPLAENPCDPSVDVTDIAWRMVEAVRRLSSWDSID